VEVVDPDTGRVLAVAEAFWEAGLQEGRGQPIVLELDTDGLDKESLQTLGYPVFTSCSGLRGTSADTTRAHDPSARVPAGYVSVQDISMHSAPDLHVHHARMHSAQPFLVRDYLN
jgi:hypothetical protein